MRMVPAIAVLVAISAMSCARADTLKCTSDSASKTDMLVHAAAVGSTLVVIAEEAGAVAIRSKPIALAVGLTTAGYALLKDYIGGSSTVVCSSLTIAGPGAPVVIARSPSFGETNSLARQIQQIELPKTSLGSTSLDKFETGLKTQKPNTIFENSLSSGGSRSVFTDQARIKALLCGADPKC